MAKKIKNEKGFLIIELTLDEARNKCKFGYDNELICDQCNKLIEDDNEIIYFIAVLNMAFCKECYEDFIAEFEHYEEDEELLEDVIIENKQAMEMTDIYHNILRRIQQYAF